MEPQAAKTDKIEEVVVASNNNASTTAVTSSSSSSTTAAAAAAAAATDKASMMTSAAATAATASKEDSNEVAVNKGGEPSPKRIRLTDEATETKQEGGKTETDSTNKTSTVETVTEEKEEDAEKENKHNMKNDSSSQQHENSSSGNGEDDEVLDICTQLGLQDGDRLEVEWQLEEPASEANGNKVTMINKWWGCKLLPHDGTTEEGVAVRQLEYDPYPEGGFPESSVEAAIFLSHEIVISPESHAEFRFRPEGLVQFNNEEETREAINGILMSTLEKHSGTWKQLDRAAQARIADGIAQKKEQLVEAIMNHSKSAVIGGEDMKAILQGIMQNKSK